MSDAVNNQYPNPPVIIEEIKRLLERLSSFNAAEWRETNRLIGYLVSNYFFAGFANRTVFESIVDRLEKFKQEKENLACYLRDDFHKSDQGKESIFIESGSTLSYFTKQLAETYPESTQNLFPQITTNNFLVQTLLFGHPTSEVNVTSGALRERYLAYLPFGKELIKDNENGNQATMDSDRVKFRRLDRILSSLDVIYATASTFGFLIGPLTGKRDNAIFKYCIFNNQAHRPIKFCIAEPKVFREAPDRYSWNFSDSKGVKDFSLPYHLSHCLLVFDINSEEQQTIANTGDIPIDGLVFSQKYRLEKVLSYEQGFDPSGERINFSTAPHDLGLEQNLPFAEKQPVVGVYATWLDFLESRRSGNIEIIIGCKTKLEADLIRDQVASANKCIESLQCYTFRYREKDDSVGTSIVHLKVEHS